MAILYRSMSAIGDQPAIGPSARMLGIRPGIDIARDNDDVSPTTGGLSVSPDSPRNLPPIRRPPVFGGTGRDPVFAIDESDLGPELVYRADPKHPKTHGFIEPVQVVTVEQFQRLLATTQPHWRLIT